MELEERLDSLANKIAKQKAVIETEEATKNAFILPFIQLVLGYDVFNPHEVIPEFTADIGTKKGEKIDFAIVKDDEIQILIEAKAIRDPLNINHASQLFRYFATTNARIAVLTNGEHWHFYTDLERPNRLDDKPFLMVNLSDLDRAHIPEIKKFSKDTFDLDSVINAAEELKYVGEIKRALVTQFSSPDEDWIKLLIAKVYDRPITQRVREQFLPLVRKASKQFLTDQVNERLKAALGSGQKYSSSPDEIPHVDSTDNEDSIDDGIETTLEEIEGFQIVRAIAVSETKATRIVHRDNKSYMAILLDDNNRKPIARLHFNGSQKYLGTFDSNKNETRHPIDSLEDIYSFAEVIRNTIHFYD